MLVRHSEVQLGAHQRTFSGNLASHYHNQGDFDLFCVRMCVCVVDLIRMNQLTHMIQSVLIDTA